MSDYRIYDRYARRIVELKDIVNAHVVEAYPLNDLFVEVWFNDGRHGVFDMKPYLKHETFKPLRDRSFFEKLYVREIDGVVAWPGGIGIAAERMYTDMEPLADVPARMETTQVVPFDRATVTIQLTIDEDQCFLAEKYALEHDATLVELLQKTISGYAASVAKTKAE